MLKAISWGQYCAVVLVLLALYYVYVGLVYYRGEILALVDGKAGARKAIPPTAEPTPIRQGGIIARSSAVAVPEAPAEEEEEAPEAEVAAEAEVEQQPAEVVELPDLDLPAEESHNEISIVVSSQNENTLASDDELLGLPEAAIAYQEENFGPDFTMDVAQLGDYYLRASEGSITAQDLAEEEPALANTDLLVSFYQSSTKSAQRSTSRLYADISEPSFS